MKALFTQTKALKLIGALTLIFICNISFSQKEPCSFKADKSMLEEIKQERDKRLELAELINDGYFEKSGARGGKTEPGDGVIPNKIYQIPIQFHVFQPDNPVHPFDESLIPTVMQNLNNAFAGSGMTFYTCSNIHYQEIETETMSIDGYKKDDYCSSSFPIPQHSNYGVTGVFNVYLSYLLTHSPDPYFNPRLLQSGFTDNCHKYVVSPFKRFENGGYGFIHEVGHVFGLPHTFEEQPDTSDDLTTFIGTDELVIRQYDASKLNPDPNCAVEGDRFCDTPADPYPPGKTDETTCTYTGTVTDANGDLFTPDVTNIMTYAYDCRNNFSNEQKAHMRQAYEQYVIDGILGFRCKCADGLYDIPDGIYEVMTGEDTITCDIIVRNGGKLVINDATLRFYEWAGIIVEPGGVLQVKSSKLSPIIRTNTITGTISKGNTWKGIYAGGTRANQYPNNNIWSERLDIRGYNSPYSGVVQLIRSEVEFALFGFSNSTGFGQNGGVLYANGSVFRNCRWGASFNGDQINADDVSRIERCLFENDDEYYDAWYVTGKGTFDETDDPITNSATPGVQVVAGREIGLDLFYNTYKSNLSIFPKVHEGVGIWAMDCGLNFVPPNQPANFVTTSTFEGHSYGMVIKQFSKYSDPILNTYIDHVKFNNVYRGIYLSNADVGTIKNCEFNILEGKVKQNLQGSDFEIGSFGIYSIGTSDFVIEKNTINGVGFERTDPISTAYGIVAVSSERGMEVLDNNINNVVYSLQTEKENPYFQFRCTKFKDYYIASRINPELSGTTTPPSGVIYMAQQGEKFVSDDKSKLQSLNEFKSDCAQPYGQLENSGPPFTYYTEVSTINPYPLKAACANLGNYLRQNTNYHEESCNANIQVPEPQFFQLPTQGTTTKGILERFRLNMREINNPTLRRYVVTNMILQLIGRDLSEIIPDILREELKYNNDVSIHKELALFYLEKGKLNECRKCLNDIPSGSLANDNFKKMINVRMQVQEGNRSLKEMTPQEIEQLHEVRQSNTEASIIAENILEYIGEGVYMHEPFGYNVTDQAQPVMEEQNNEGSLNALQVAPNPFEHETKVYYDVQQQQKVELAVYDYTGREVLRQPLNSKKRSITIKSLEKGFYLAVLEVDGKISSKTKIICE